MKTKVSEQFIFGMYCAALIIQNLLALKSIDILGFTMTTGVLVSPIVFMTQDVETELYGFKNAAKMILLGYGMQFIYTILMCIAIAIPPSGVYANQASFETIFSTTFRITAASFVAYCVGSLVNAKIMDMKKEKRGLFFRAISSTVAGQVLDNAIFAFGAFLGIMPVSALVTMVIGGTIWEVVYEIIFFPVTKGVIKKLKKEPVPANG